MRRQKKPPKRFRISWEDSHDDHGAVRKWASNKATNDFRRYLTLWLRKQQKNYCSYCTLSVGEAGRRAFALDHFVPKNQLRGEPEWTFEIYNLILSCEYCNEKRKKQLNPLIIPGQAYKKSEFSIVHPYLDKVSDHINGGYRGGADVPSTPRALTDKGRQTVMLFALDTANMRALWYSEYQMAVGKKIRKSWDPKMLNTFNNIIDELSR